MKYFLFNKAHKSFLFYDKDTCAYIHRPYISLHFSDISNMCYIEANSRSNILGNSGADHEESATKSVKPSTNKLHSCGIEIEVTILPVEEDIVTIEVGGKFLSAAKSERVDMVETPLGDWEKFCLFTERDAIRFVQKRHHAGMFSHKPARLHRIGEVRWYGDELIEVKNARVIATDWSVITEKNVIYMPNKNAHIQRCHQNDIITHIRPSLPTIESAILIGGYYNYYHYLVDYLMNIFSFNEDEYHDLPIITIETQHQFQEEALRIFGIKDRVVALQHLSSVKVKNLIIPKKSVMGAGHVMNKTAFQRIYDYTRRNLDVQQNNRRRIFISRNKASTRRAINEIEAAHLLHDFGFEFVELENLSLQSQIEMFYEAEAIAGIHGAGFTNMIFTRPGCKIIEFMPEDKWQPGFFRNMSRGLGHFHESIPAQGSFNSTSIVIDLEKLKSVAERLFS